MHNAAQSDRIRLAIALARRAFGQFFVEAALIELGHSLALEFIAFVEEGESEAITNILENARILGPSDDGTRAHHC